MKFSKKKLIEEMVDLYLANLQKNTFSYGCRQGLKSLASEMGVTNAFHKRLEEKRGPR